MLFYDRGNLIIGHFITGKACYLLFHDWENLLLIIPWLGNLLLVIPLLGKTYLLFHDWEILKRKQCHSLDYFEMYRCTWLKKEWNPPVWLENCLKSLNRLPHQPPPARSLLLEQAVRRLHGSGSSWSSKRWVCGREKTFGIAYEWSWCWYEKSFSITFWPPPPVLPSLNPIYIHATLTRHYVLVLTIVIH